jgi:hypothetical protein
MRKSKLPPKRIDFTTNYPEERQEKAQALQKEQEAKDKHLWESINMVAATPEGQDLLRFIKELAGFRKHKAVVDTQSGEICVQSTAYNVGRESLYLTLTSKIDPKYLKKIEY